MLLKKGDLLEDETRGDLGETDEELGEGAGTLCVLRVELLVGDLPAYAG